MSVKRARERETRTSMDVKCCGEGKRVSQQVGSGRANEAEDGAGEATRRRVCMHGGCARKRAGKGRRRYARWEKEGWGSAVRPRSRA